MAIDLEIEKDQILEECITDIVETLANFDYSLSFQRDRVRLFSERLSEQLDEKMSVEDAGIWNGDYIYLLEVK